MRRRQCSRWLVLAIVLACAGTVSAHPLDTAYLRVEATGNELAITYDLDATLAAQELGVEAAAGDAALATRALELAAKLYRSASPVVGNEACTWGTVTASRKGTTTTLVDRATCPPGTVQWDLSFVKRLGATYQILGKTIVVSADGGAVEEVITIDKAHTSLTMARASGTSFVDSIWGGVEHVGLLPRAWKGLPRGIECLALAILLLLGAAGLTRQLTQLWMLVVGNAIGISVGSLLPPAFGMGLLIAAIAAAAGSLITGRLERHRWVIALVAGGAHGVATLPLTGHPIGFAAGFAIAILAIGVVLGPACGTLVKREDLAKKVVPVAAIALAGVAIFGVVRWF